MAQAQIPLRDLHLPEDIGLWPLAPGWWIVIVVLSLLLLWGGRKAWRTHRHNAARRLALRRLGEIHEQYQSTGDAVGFAKQLSALLRRAMLAYAPRDEVAGLTGEAWLEWLDDGLGLPMFETTTGRLLLELPYRDPDTRVSENEVGHLLNAAKMRIGTPVRGER